MDCFAALAMTLIHARPQSRGADAPELCRKNAEAKLRLRRSIERGGWGKLSPRAPLLRI
jgi:hypothetical protein